MRQVVLVADDSESVISEIGDLVVTARGMGYQWASIIVGRPGMPNLSLDELGIGEASIYETPEGLFEIRLLSVTESRIKVLVSEIAPLRGLTAGYVERDAENAPFTESELKRLSASLRQIKTELSSRDDLSSEQQDFIARKLVEMEDAGKRLGRKDWINWALGTLTNLSISAALNPAAAKALFQAASGALGWIVGAPIRLLE